MKMKGRRCIDARKVLKKLGKKPLTAEIARDMLDEGDRALERRVRNYSFSYRGDSRAYRQLLMKRQAESAVPRTVAQIPQEPTGELKRLYDILENQGLRAYLD